MLASKMNQKQRDALTELLAMKVSMLGFPVSTMSALEGAGIRTVAELVRTPESKFLKLVGTRRTKEIKDKLNALGLSDAAIEHKSGI